MKPTFFLALSFLFHFQLFAQSNKEMAPVLSDTFAIGADFQTPGRVVYDWWSGIDTLPSFPGGEKALERFLAENCRLSAADKENSFSGTVIATFIIEPDGSISTKTMLRGAIFSKSIFEMIDRMPHWVPGIKNGQLIPFKWLLPIRISIE